MICVTVGRTRHKHTIAEHAELGQLGAQLVELRLDYIGRSIDLGRLIKDRPTPAVITCRRKEDGGRWERTEDERRMLLRSAIAAGVEYVDLEEDAAKAIPRYGKTKRIVSIHNFEETPEDLEAIHARLSKIDADIIKIATIAHSFADVIRMLRLMESTQTPTIAISMGDIGTVTRILGPRFGAPFTYCTFSSERRVAPGQLTYQQMTKLYRVDEITPETRIFGVIADPVQQSMSPLIHNAAFALQKLNARYIPFRVPAEDLGLFLKWAQSFGIGGLSVTIPHKESVLPFLTRAESSAQDIGAVNTLAITAEEMIGYNTDYRAAMDCLVQEMTDMTNSNEPFRGRNVLILGAGGVSRAIGYGMRQRGANVFVASRTMERSEKLAQSIGGKAVPWQARYELKAAVIINGTPIGMFPDVDNTPFDAAKLDSRMLVFDTIYNPNPTLLLKQAHAAGCRTISGVKMFVQQAGYQYKLFTGQEPPLDAMNAILRKAISPVNF
jgi:3-dehydroquinate dehydratase / shikimate dehydrogenase